MPGRFLRYDVVDVFAARPFAGNPLAVVHGGGDLGAAQCLALAREFNLSETTFPVEVGPGSYRTRIFTPGGEIPFAGHPTLGTAWVLRAGGALSGDRVTQSCGVGEVPVRFTGDGLVELQAAPRDLAGPLEGPVVADLLAEVGLAGTDLAGPCFVAGTGLGFVHLPVRAAAVARARPARRDVAVCLGSAAGGLIDPLGGINVYAVSPESDGTSGSPGPAVHARVFVPGLGIAEDPATGSAATGLGMALVASGVLPGGGPYTVRQGAELGRPSLLSAHVEVAEGAEGAEGVVSGCRVAGEVHQVATGRVAVP